MLFGLVTTRMNKYYYYYYYVGSPFCGLSDISTSLVFNQSFALTQPGHPSGVGKMSASESCGVSSHTTQCTSPAVEDGD